MRKDGTKVDWAKQINASWHFGEDGGYAQLCRFLEEDVEHYDKVSQKEWQKAEINTFYLQIVPLVLIGDFTY